jgi:hypothetical protein
MVLNTFRYENFHEAQYHLGGGHVLVMAISNSHVNDHPISTRKSQESFGIYRLTLGMVAVLYF